MKYRSMSLGQGACLKSMPRTILTMKDFTLTAITGLEKNQLRSNQRTIGPENAHLKPDLGVLSQHEMTLTLNTHIPLLTS